MSDGYTREPERFDEEAAREHRGADPDDDPTENDQGAHPEAVDREFGWRGWTLVGAVFVAFLVVPGLISVYPHVGSMFGLTFYDTYLALPMIPALVVGALAVWATTRP
jgi:hypothetical protein